MPEIPDEMKQNGRQSDDVFLPLEYLYRRVPHEFWASDRVNVDAIDLPDMSVNREKYSRPEWVRLADESFHDWGVIGFQVEHIPPRIQHLGVHLFIFRPKHVPLRLNYGHSEVQAHYAKMDDPQQTSHVNKVFLKREQIGELSTVFPEELQLRWRELLRRKCKIFLQAGQEV